MCLSDAHRGNCAAKDPHRFDSSTTISTKTVMLQYLLTRRIRAFQCHFSKIQRQHRPSFRCLTIAHPKVASSGPKAAPRSPHKHVHLNAEGVEIELKFVEEPLAIPADQGHGYLRVEFGGSIDPERRFKIVRKLGWGTNSSIWMAFDEIDKKYVAIKALKGYSTGLFERGVMLELPALERSTLGSPPPGLTSSHCLHLLCFFFSNNLERIETGTIYALLQTFWAETSNLSRRRSLGKKAYLYH
ncbi:hypothetical protein BDR05DRAFT_429172 [Suillus weaverae]|nr:hypothetical protein BDR05DRAFT_429172 [Suillus weaverae]